MYIVLDQYKEIGKITCFLIGNGRTTIKLNHHEFEICAIIRLLFSGDVELRFLLRVFKVRIRVELIV